MATTDTLTGVNVALSYSGDRHLYTKTVSGYRMLEYIKPPAGTLPYASGAIGPGMPTAADGSIVSFYGDDGVEWSWSTRFIDVEPVNRTPEMYTVGDIDYVCFMADDTMNVYYVPHIRAYMNTHSPATTKLRFVLDGGATTVVDEGPDTLLEDAPDDHDDRDDVEPRDLMLARGAASSSTGARRLTAKEREDLDRRAYQGDEMSDEPEDHDWYPGYGLM